MTTVQQGFQGTNDASSAEQLFTWLEFADAQPSVQEIKRRMFEAAPACVGDQVLDVGCGIGLEAMRLAWHTGPAGRVVGIDVSARMITEARRRAAAEAWPSEFLVVDAQQLEFPDAAFDLCRSERVLRYVEDPALAVREMARVVRPGGRVVVFDFDSDSTIIDTPDPALARRVRDILDAAVPHGWIGRQLPRLFRAAGLDDVQVVPHVLLLPTLESYRRLVGGTLELAVCDGRLRAAEHDRWWAELEQAERAGTFLVANLGFIVGGRRPDPGATGSP